MELYAHKFTFQQINYILRLRRLRARYQMCESQSLVHNDLATVKRKLLYSDICVSRSGEDFHVVFQVGNAVRTCRSTPKFRISFFVVRSEEVGKCYLPTRSPEYQRRLQSVFFP